MSSVCGTANGRTTFQIDEVASRLRRPRHGRFTRTIGRCNKTLKEGAHPSGVDKPDSKDCLDRLCQHPGERAHSQYDQHDAWPSKPSSQLSRSGRRQSDPVARAGTGTISRAPASPRTAISLKLKSTAPAAPAARAGQAKNSPRRIRRHPRAKE